MVGVGVEGAAADGYYGEYYAPPPDQFFVAPEMCQHPQQHPQHAHMCTVHADYGGMPVVTSTAMMPQMMPQVLDENMRHFVLAHPHPHQHPHQHPQQLQPHHQPPHHQPPHHYGPANGTGGPQHFYNAGYTQHYHHVPPHHMQPSPPPPVYQKDERTQRQYSKLKQKLERKQNNRNNGIELNSGASTPSLSPRKEANGRGGGSGGASSGAWSEGEGSSAGASTHGDDDDTQATLDMLCATRTPQVSDMTPTSALVQWNSRLPEGVTLPNDLTYDLLLGDKGRYKAIYSGPSLSCRVRDLRPGCEYSVCLQARAGAAVGAVSEATTFRAPPAPPAAPPPPRVTQRTRTTLLLRWHSAADNGAKFVHFVLQLHDGEEWQEAARPRTRQHTVPNLKPQTCYRFRVAAVNECGRGEWSDETVVWTAGAPPPAPPPPALLAAAPAALCLAWEPRPGDEYTLQMDDPARGHGFLPIYSGPGQEHRADQLHRATSYRFRLRCENTDGQSPWSSDVTYTTLPERPAPPGRPTTKGKIHSRSLRFRWDPPADDGGSPVTSYTLELDAGDGFEKAYSGSDREATCDRLQPGTEYRVRVKCATLAGESDWAAGEGASTEPCAPAAPAPPAPAAPPRATAAPLRWRPPDCTGGTAITEYRIHLTDADGNSSLAYTGQECECTLRELTPGHRYQATVTAINKVGASPPSTAIEFTTAAAPPDAPESLAAAADCARAARLEWTAPRDNGAPILDYRLEMSANSAEAFSEVYRGVETNCIVRELTPFSPYFFRVAARNSAGRGTWSTIRELLTPRAPPAAPTAIKYDAAADSLRLYWRVPAAYGADVLRYRVRLDDADFETEGPEPERLVEGLEPDTVYRVRVAALSELGVGEWSEEARASTRPPPPAPPAIRCAHAAHNCLKLEWESRGEGAQYCVELRPPDAKEFRPVYRGSARWCKVKKLRESSEYWFRIRASDERGGRGSWGAAVAAATPAAPPPAPRAPALTPLPPRAALAAWDPVDDAEYLLQCAKAKDAIYKQVYAGRAAQFQLEELEAGAEYLVRVCAVRGGLAGAWSAAGRVALPAAPAPARPRRARPPPRLSPRHAALIMAAAFLLLACLVAALLQRLVEPRP